jgi:YD repeat-containing protein
LHQVITHIDALNHTYSFEYDARGRPIEITKPDSTSKSIVYDDVNNSITVFDENLHKKELKYDWTNKLVWVKEFYDSVNYYLTQYEYDQIGNLTSIIDAHSHTTHYTYSLFGLTHILYPDSTSQTFTYDDIGNCIQTENALGTTTYTYNEIYQLTGIDYPDQSISFTYDENGNQTLMTDGTGTTTSVYDTRNRCISESKSIDNHTYTVTYEYDAASRVTSMTYPDQTALLYQYDALNRLTDIPGYAHFSYTDTSLLSLITYDNGVTTTFDYDARHHLMRGHV